MILWMRYLVPQNQSVDATLKKRRDFSMWYTRYKTPLSMEKLQRADISQSSWTYLPWKSNHVMCEKLSHYHKAPEHTYPENLTMSCVSIFPCFTNRCKSLNLAGIITLSTLSLFGYPNLNHWLLNVLKLIACIYKFFKIFLILISYVCCI